jgi:hypothetical protein
MDFRCATLEDETVSICATPAASYAERCTVVTGQGVTGQGVF